MSISNLKPPYVRNGPRLETANRRSTPKSIQWHLAHDAVLEVHAQDQPQARLIADRIELSWNYHDPLVDVLQELLAQPDSSTVRANAQRLLNNINDAENG
jgi:hypothetical protein